MPDIITKPVAAVMILPTFGGDLEKSILAL
jgi:hypothetical protein